MTMNFRALAFCGVLLVAGAAAADEDPRYYDDLEPTREAPAAPAAAARPGASAAVNRAIR